MVYNKSMEYNREYEERLYKAIKDEPDDYEETGQISGSKVAQPAFTAILTMLGVEKEFDGYTLAKFARGHDVEEKFIDRVFDKKIDGNEWYSEEHNSYYTWQYEIPEGYRGATCSIDLLEKTTYPDDPLNEEQYILHEIKSVGKMKYDRVTASGMRKKGTPEPDYSHCLQVALYALSLDKMPMKCLIHYVNADDYRVATFEINPLDYKKEVDKRIDRIYEAFATHQIPAYEPYEPWQKGKYNSFNAVEGLSQEEAQSWVERHYPKEYQKFMKAKWSEKGIKYED